MAFFDMTKLAFNAIYMLVLTGSCQGLRLHIHIKNAAHDWALSKPRRCKRGGQAEMVFLSSATYQGHKERFTGKRQDTTDTGCNSGNFMEIYILKKKITMKVVTCGKGLSKEAVKSPSLETFKTGLASTPDHLLGTCSAWEVGPRNPQESSPG